MAYGAGKSGSMERYAEKNHPEWLKKLAPQGQEPTSKKSSLKISSSGNQSGFEPKGGYKDKRRS